MKRIALGLGFVVALSCTNQKLVPVTDGVPPVVDDLVDIEAQFCTRPAEDVAFPVKLLLVVDTSGSMQFTDQPSLRVNAVRQLVSNLITQTNVLVSTMGFGSNVYVEPQVLNVGDPLFVPAAEWNEPAFLQIKDVATDYHGAFAAIQTHLLRDMLQSDPAELARTKYIVIFFSDGLPDPKCCLTADETVGELTGDPFGCPLDAWEVAQPGVRYCENAAEQNLCNDSDFYDQFVEGVDAVVGGTQQPDYGEGVNTALQDLKLEGNYNRTYQIQSIAEDIMEMGREFGVGQLQINTALLFDDTLPDAVKEILRLNKCRSSALMQSIAEIGEGQFRDFENAGEIDFLSFNFTSLKQGFTLISSYAVNLNALAPGGDPAVVDFRADSDGDGLDDDVEFNLGTDAAVADSDKLLEPLALGVTPVPLNPSAWGDGFDDAFEARRSGIGFDPRFQLRPLRPCPLASLDLVDRNDLDGDGLNGCEEQILQTDAKLADTDGDTLPDGLESRLNLDPTRAEEARDDDFDGTPNLEEVRKGLDPLVPDADREETAIRYELIENGSTEDGRTCYTSIARGVHLASTQPRFLTGRRGYNDLFFVVAEAPIDNPTGRIELRVACIRAQYVAPTFKDPANGKIEIREEDFLDLSNAEVITRINSGEDICGGVGIR